MKRPNLAWRNHCIFSSCDLGAGSGWAPGCARAAPAGSSARQIISDKLLENPRFMGSLLGDPLFPHKTVRNSREGVARWWDSSLGRTVRAHFKPAGEGPWPIGFGSGVEVNYSGGR